MSTFLRAIIGEPIVTPLTEVTLDAVWREAERLGGIRVWRYEHSQSYEVTIAFTRRTGTKVEAKAAHSDIVVAMGRAIDEAREMGAGREG